MSGDRIKERVAGRSYAAGLMQMIDEELDKMSMDFRVAALFELQSLINLKVPVEAVAVEPDVMSEADAVAFEKKRIAFGQHHGLTFHEVPINYLTWIADQSIHLRRYLKSARGKKRIEEQW